MAALLGLHRHGRARARTAAAYASIRRSRIYPRRLRTITLGDEQREVKAGGIVVIPAGTPHRFVNSGDTTLCQIGIHASPHFIQTNLT